MRAVVGVEQVAAHDRGRRGGLRAAPSPSSSSASVASAAAREKRVGGRNSRTSSHDRAAARRRGSRRRTASANAARSTAVHTSARAAAKRALVLRGDRGVGAVERPPRDRPLGRTAGEHDSAAARASSTRGVVPASDAAEDERRLGVREREPDVGRRVHGAAGRRGSRRRARGSPRARPRSGKRAARLLDDLDLRAARPPASPDRRSPLLAPALAAEHVRLLRREPLARRSCA